MTRSRPRDGAIFYWLFAAMLAGGVLAEGVVGIAVLVDPNVTHASDTVMKAFLTPLIFVGIGFLGLVSAASLQRGESAVVMRLTIMVTLLTGAALLLVIWNKPMLNVLGRATSCLAVLLVTLTLIGQADRQKIESPELATFQRLVFVSAAALAAVAILLLSLGWWEWWTAPYLAVAGFGWGLATLLAFAAVPIAAGTRKRRARRKRTKETIPLRIELLLTCPRCAHAQRLPTGVGRCKNCKCALVIEVEEPRCTCGYLLYQLQGETCPECGRVIDPEQRWGGSAT